MSDFVWYGFALFMGALSGIWFYSFIWKCPECLYRRRRAKKNAEREFLRDYIVCSIEDEYELRPKKNKD